MGNQMNKLFFLNYDGDSVRYLVEAHSRKRAIQKWLDEKRAAGIILARRRIANCHELRFINGIHDILTF